MVKLRSQEVKTKSVFVLHNLKAKKKLKYVRRSATKAMQSKHCTSNELKRIEIMREDGSSAQSGDSESVAALAPLAFQNQNQKNNFTRSTAASRLETDKNVEESISKSSVKIFEACSESDYEALPFNGLLLKKKSEVNETSEKSSSKCLINMDSTPCVLEQDYLEDHLNSVSVEQLKFKN